MIHERLDVMEGEKDSVSCILNNVKLRHVLYLTRSSEVLTSFSLM